MKILLMDPPWYSFMEGNVQQPSAPLGNSYIAASLKQAGHEVTILNIDLLAISKTVQYSFTNEMKIFEDYLKNSSDSNHPVWQEVKKVIIELQPDIIGMTARTTSFTSALSVASLAKNINPEIKIVLGGAHPTLMPEEAASAPNVDAIVRGEGEITIVELVHAWDTGAPLQGIAGISYLDKKENRVFHAPSRALIDDLDSIPFPAKDLIYKRETLMEEDDYNTILSSRGCPYQCIFCSSPKVWTKKNRYRSAKNVVQEMIQTYEKFDTRFFSFQDDTFTLNMNATHSLCDALIASDLTKVPGFRWVCNTRPDRLDRPLVEKMKQAGCSAIAIGVESGNDEILLKMKKGFTTNDVRNAARIINETGLVLATQFMIGLPFETEEHMWDTFHFAEEIEPVSVVLSVAAPLPGTELYTIAQELGYSPEEMNLASVTTKNNGILFNKRYSADERSRIVSEISSAFDDLQERKLVEKNESRLRYERLYKKTVYGFDDSSAQ